MLEVEKKWSYLVVDRRLRMYRSVRESDCCVVMRRRPLQLALLLLLLLTRGDGDATLGALTALRHHAVASTLQRRQVWAYVVRREGKR